MIDLGREIAAAVRVDWRDDRLQAARSGLQPRLRRRARRRVAMGSALVVAALGLAIALWPARPRDPAAVPTVAVPALPLPAPPAFRSTRLDATSVVRTVTATPRATVVELARGAAGFEVDEDPGRVVRVVSGVVSVESFGAVFACSQVDQATRVDVFRGTVQVLWADQHRELAAGAHAVFPPPPPTVPIPKPVLTRVPPRVVDDGWRTLARDGDFDRAYAALARPDAAPVRDEPEELLLAADVNRLSHHAAEAVAPLRAVVRDHATDPRASLAAFTLGRVLLEELGRPSDAAAAFADAVRLAPDGPMTEDAIAREVEALSRAGDTDAATRLAKEYLERFPAGRKARSVRRFGNLE